MIQVGDKKQETKKAKIIAVLRRMFWYSKERAAALKRDQYICKICSAKKIDGVKLNVHHVRNVDFDKIVKLIRKELLCDHVNLITMCNSCHYKLHAKEKFRGKK